MQANAQTTTTAGSNVNNRNGAAAAPAAAAAGTTAAGSNSSKKPSDLELFPGFKPAIEGCTLDWSKYPISGVTYGHNSHYLSPFAVFKLDEPRPGPETSGVNSSQVSTSLEVKF